jgi:Fe-coproporphyrin III synthase
MSVEVVDDLKMRRDGLPDEIVSLPILILNVHENCNCRCGMCDIWKRPPGSEISLDKVAEYESSIRKLGVKQLVLTGGEPLMHSRFRPLCMLLKQCDVRITVLSTGLLMKKKADVLAECVDEIIVSLDGPRTLHDRIRGIPKAFDLIQEGLLAVRKLRPDLPIRARSTIQAANFLSLRRTVAAALELGCTSISFLAVDTNSQAFNRELVWPVQQQQALGLHADHVRQLEQEVEKLIKDCADLIQSGFIVESPEKLRRLVGSFRQRLGEVSPQSPVCNAPWVSTVVEVDGSLRPCFFQPKYKHTEGLSLERAINTDAARAFRSNLSVPNNPTCQQCVCSLNYR